jgi:alkylation response protein AidB-like acyl-CoA dehydrogenase
VPDTILTPDLASRLAALQRTGTLTLPAPGDGFTAVRHAALLEFGRTDLSLARLVEAHADALAILAEAGRPVTSQLLYGVWASDGPGGRLEISRNPHDGGALRLNGTKRYCSGAGIVSAALVTAHDEADQIVLLDVPLQLPGITLSASEWASPAFAETRTASLTFDHVKIPVGSIVSKGEPTAPSANWYLTRPGFWHGALGPAACWAGGAIGLIDAVCTLNKRDPHFRANLGALEAAEWGLRAILNTAAAEIDADPLDTAGEARRRALMARHLIERLCTEVMDRFGRATGPQLLAFNPDIAQRYAELTLYIRQSHAEKDLAAIPREAG